MAPFGELLPSGKRGRISMIDRGGKTDSSKVLEPVVEALLSPLSRCPLSSCWLGSPARSFEGCCSVRENQYFLNKLQASGSRANKLPVPPHSLRIWGQGLAESLHDEAEDALFLRCGIQQINSSQQIPKSENIFHLIQFSGRKHCSLDPNSLLFRILPDPAV